MQKSKGVIGIDLGTESIKIVALECVRGESLPRVVGVGASISKGMRKGVIYEENEVAESIEQAIHSLETATGLAHGRAYIGMGGLGLGFQKSRGLVAISRADGKVSKEDMNRAVQASETNLSKIQNREVLYHVPISFRIDGESPIHNPFELSGMKLESETMFITAFSQQVKSVLKVADEARIDLEDIVAGPLAMAHAVLSKREKEVGVMLINLGAATTSVILFEEGLSYSLEVLPVGSSHITNDIAVGFQISLEESEKLKINYGAVAHVAPISKKDDLIHGAYSKKKLAEIIEARLDDIFELVEKHLKKVDRVGLLPAGAVMIGGGSNLQGISEFAKNYLKLPARIASSENVGGLKDKVKDSAWSTAVGIALLALDEKESSSPLLRGQSGSFFKWLRAFLP